MTVKDCVPANLKIEGSMPEVHAREKGDVHWMLGELGARASKVITVSAVAEEKGSFTSCAEVFYDSPTCAKINIVEAKLRLVKAAPSRVLKCDRIPVTYVVTKGKYDD